MDYAAFTATTIVVLALLAMATEILGARTGRLGVSAIVVAGVSAHAYALCSGTMATLTAIAVAMLCGLVVAAVTATVINRLTADMFLLVTLAAQLVFVSTVRNTAALGGMIGARVAPLQLSGSGLSAAALACCAVAIAVTQWIFGSRTIVAAAYVSVAEDEVAARSAGLPVAALRRTATMVHGILASAAGLIMALQYRYVAAEIFDLRLSLTVLTAMYIGGPGQPPHRQIYGAAAVVAVEEAIAWILSGSSAVGPVQRVVVNMLLVAILAWNVLRARTAR